MPFKIVPNTGPEGNLPPGEEPHPEEEFYPGEEPPPEEHPPGEEPPHEEPMNDEEAIKQALMAELGWSESEIQLNIGRMDDRFAEGGVSKGGEMGGAMWLAAKEHDGRWVIIHHGHDIPTCDQVQNHNIPLDWAPSCWDEASDSVIERTGSKSLGE
ncbi:MAG: hypothetical protein H8E29_16585 [Anaerolineales bacterium]|uniref:Uncharacterized protein n=1 Tax=Candidatus Desulfolinea nitratireducens TaxID=2841698 RepID=A0A8J6NRN7_9CHLR|nr:hypothetical protein [Candidatus Desulfolinea nitratireducens]